MLTYWRGTSRQGIGTGELVMRDQAYRVIRRIRSVNGLPPDLHEFKIVGDKAILISYPIVRQNLKAVKGGKKRDLVVDSVIQEVDIPTGLVTFEWHSLGHIPHQGELRAAAAGHAVRLRAHELGQPPTAATS